MCVVCDIRETVDLITNYSPPSGLPQPGDQCTRHLTSVMPSSWHASPPPPTCRQFCMRAASDSDRVTLQGAERGAISRSRGARRGVQAAVQLVTE